MTLPVQKYLGKKVATLDREVFSAACGIQSTIYAKKISVSQGREIFSYADCPKTDNTYRIAKLVSNTSGRPVYAWETCCPGSGSSGSEGSGSTSLSGSKSGSGSESGSSGSGSGSGSGSIVPGVQTVCCPDGTTIKKRLYATFTNPNCPALNGYSLPMDWSNATPGFPNDTWSGVQTIGPGNCTLRLSILCGVVIPPFGLCWFVNIGYTETNGFPETGGTVVASSVACSPFMMGPLNPSLSCCPFPGTTFIITE